MKIRYSGAGDSVEVDGIEIKKGETAEVTSDQYARLVATPDAVVEVLKADGETLDDAFRIREAQAEQREKIAAAREREAKRPKAAPEGKK